jgi:hypothetical protein
MIKIALLAAICLLTVACTTMRPVLESRDEFAEQIRTGALLKPGDRIRIVTDGGTQQELRVAEIRADGTIVGNRSAVRVDEIASLEKRERSWVKTGVLLGLVGLTLLGSDCEDDPGCDLGYGGFCCS